MDGSSIILLFYYFNFHILNNHQNTKVILYIREIIPKRTILPKYQNNPFIPILFQNHEAFLFINLPFLGISIKFP
jgi:hypothetical protein